MQRVNILINAYVIKQVHVIFLSNILLYSLYVLYKEVNIVIRL